MPEVGSYHPRAAFVEDWDDDAETTVSSSRATANVAVKRSQTGLVSERPKTKHHDNDSGYSSKAPTVGSASSVPGKMAGLKIDTSLQERERHPYLMSAGGRREAFTRPSAVGNAPALAPVAKFVHDKGVCMTCDYYGYHMEQPPAATMQPPNPSSPKVSKKTAAAIKKPRDVVDPSLKRMSSHQSAPAAAISPAPAVQPVFPANPYVQAGAYSPMVYTYATPVTSTYVGPPGQTSYFDPHLSSEARPAKPQRRSSQYGEPVIKQTSQGSKHESANKAASKRPAHESHRSLDYISTSSAREAERRPAAQVRRDSDSRPKTSIESEYSARYRESEYRTEPREVVTQDHRSEPRESTNRDYKSRPEESRARDDHSRSTRDLYPGDEHMPYASTESSSHRLQMTAHRSSRSSDKDRIAMPPPTRPDQQAEVNHRPSLMKSSTYNADKIDRRRSRDVEEEMTWATRVPPSPKMREAPPSSYRPLQQEQPSRPQLSRKSVSYSDPVTTTRVSQTSSSKAESRHRQSTNPVTAMEQKTAAAEAYQQSRSNMTSEELTAEKLNALKKSRSHTQSSETGSAYSHRESHHSSSRGSSGRVRSHTSGQRTSILIDKGIKLDIPADYERKGRPVSVDLGNGMTLSIGSKDKEKKKDAKQIEKAPSVASHASKKSITSASYESHHEEGSKSSRPPPQNDDRRPPVTDRSQKSSLQHSRAPSTTRGGSRRQSGDYSGGYSGW